MAKSFKCPNCGSASREKLSDTEFKCIHCETIFFDTSKEDVKRAVEDELRKSKKGQHDAMAASYKYATNMRRTILFVVITFMLLGMGFAFYMVQKTMSAVNEQTEQIQSEVNKSLKENGVKK